MVPLVRVRERDFRSFLDRHSCQDKYDIAATLTQWFPELAWRLPARPKFYDPEPRSILYFDCIALAIAHLEIANTETMGGKEVFSPASK